MRLYKSTDEEREIDFHKLITPENRDNKLIDLAGLQPDGYYEFDLELPCVNLEISKLVVEVLRVGFGFISHSEIHLSGCCSTRWVAKTLF